MHTEEVVSSKLAVFNGDESTSFAAYYTSFTIRFNNNNFKKIYIFLKTINMHLVDFLRCVLIGTLSTETEKELSNYCIK